MEKNRVNIRERKWLLLAIVMMLFLAEAGSRVFNFAPGPRVIAFHDSLGWVHVPGAETERNGISIRINPNGLRDEDHSYTKPPGTYRVLFLGDSFVEAFQVPLESAVSERLEEMLVTVRPGQTIEVINAGVSGYGTGNQLRYYVEEGRKYTPDLVILAFFMNDVYDNVERPLYLFEGEDLVPNPDQRSMVLEQFPELRSGIWEVSYAYRNLAVLVKIWRAQSALAEFGPSIEGVDRIYYDDLAPELERGWEYSEALLGELHKAVEADGIPLIVVLIPAREATSLGPDSPGYNHDQVDSRLNEILARLDICYISLSQPFSEQAQTGTELYIPGDGHLNPEGHDLAAQVILSELQGCVP